jgi:hypothetical protein
MESTLSCAQNAQNTHVRYWVSIIAALMELIHLAEDAKKNATLAYKSENGLEEQASATQYILYHYHLSDYRDDELKTILEQRESELLQKASNASGETNQLLTHAQHTARNVLSKIKLLLGELAHGEIHEQINRWDNSLIYWYVCYLWKMNEDSHGSSSPSLDVIFERLTSQIEQGSYPETSEIERDIKILEDETQNLINPCPITLITIVILYEVKRRATL